MAGTKPKIRFSKVIEILLWLAGLGVLAENIFRIHPGRTTSRGSISLSIQGSAADPCISTSSGKILTW
jgi:hypothetical protein